MATRKIHFFTGKGGVGKSTLAAAFADHLADPLARGSSSGPSSKILLAELTERSFYNHFFNSPAADLSKSGKHSLKFDLAQWSPEACLREYALHLLKIESLYKLFFQNPVSRSLIQVARVYPNLRFLEKPPHHHADTDPRLSMTKLLSIPLRRDTF